MRSTRPILVLLEGGTPSQPIVEAIISNKIAAIPFAFLPEQVGLCTYGQQQYLLNQYERFGNTAGPIFKQETQAFNSLSSGQQKLFMLDYALSGQFSVLILDDAFSHIDVYNRTLYIQKLEAYCQNSAIIQLAQDLSQQLLPDMQVLDLRQATEATLSNKFTLPPSEKPFVHCPTNLVELRNISVAYGQKQVFQDISWTIAPAQLWQLKGPNGAGKSTLLSMIVGDNPKAYGQNIQLFGRQKGSGESVWELKQKIGYFTPSQTNLYQRRTTVLEMIISGIFDSVGLYKIPSERHIRIGKQWLAAIGLLPQANEQFHTLSVLNQRLLMLARAMVKEPQLLLLDEPFAGLSPSESLEIELLLAQLVQRRTSAVVLVSHQTVQVLTPLVLEL
jgi:molybdate transport system ATP-binding protein